MQLKTQSEGRDFPDFQHGSPLLTLDLYHVFRIKNFQTIYAKNISLMHLCFNKMECEIAKGVWLLWWYLFIS